MKTKISFIYIVFLMWLPVTTLKAQYFGGQGRGDAMASITSVYLPIELLDFTAYVDGHNAELRWRTATETNNDYFTIERTKDGNNYETIARVKGSGTTSSVRNYQTTDTEPLPGHSYYRLKQTDFDGKFTYSNLAPVDFETVSTENGFSIYPNPSTSGQTMRLNLTAPENEQVLVVVYDTMGKEYFSKIIITQQSGDNMLALDPNSKLASGVYYVTATTNNKVFRKKLVIQ
jgi:hypothetical protein